MRYGRWWLTSGLILACYSGLAAAEGSHARLRAVPFTQVKVQDGFWLPRIETNRMVTVPHDLDWCEKTGRITNFVRAAGLEEGEFVGARFNDSDVYKVLEGAAYTLQVHPDPQLEARVDAVIDKIAASQQPDGYLNSYFTLVKPKDRWTNLERDHELYSAGHMFEAAVAYYQATGKRKLLDVSCRFADYIGTVFGPGKRIGWPGHEEIELALIKLYRATGQERYRKLAEFFISARGTEGQSKHEYDQSHLPVKEQSEIVGHAVRAMYLYSGVADVAAMTGEKGYIDAMERLWQNVTGRKMYLTGGIGSTGSNEGFSADYELPNDIAYCETCASIGMALWNHRLLMLHGQGRFADVLERVMYNGLSSGVSLDGKLFFYRNPLGNRGNSHRQEWFGCACCPTNIVRFLPSVGGYIYAVDDGGVWVNLYVAGEAETTAAGTKIKLVQKTDYPWDGKIKITLQPDKAAEFAVHLRIPGWADSYSLKVNGQAAPGSTKFDGYVALSRSWKTGDVIELDLPMPVRRVYAHPRVQADRGRVALQRGPMVYCLEGVDHGGKVANIFLPPDAKLTARKDKDLLGGVAVLEGQARRSVAQRLTEDLYLPATATEPVAIKAIPYYAWDNRGVNEMVVWLPEAVGLAEPTLPPSLASGASVDCSVPKRLEQAQTVNDGMLPRSSDDAGTPVFVWSGEPGKPQWISYALDRPELVSCAEVYWWTGSHRGQQGKLPASWRVLWKKGQKWVPVEPVQPYTTERDTWSRVWFKPVPAIELRLEVQPPEGGTVGLYEWRLP